MFKLYKNSSSFTKNVITLMTGTTIAQVIPIAISPILTRIYTPEDFGLFAIYMSIVSILAVIATGRYELAIMLPKKDENAINIVVLSMIITLVISFIILLVIFFFNLEITNLLGNKEISNWLYFTPISILLIGFYQSMNYWVNRKKRYKILAGNRIIQSTSTSSSNLLFGFINILQGGLMISSILGQFLATLFLQKNIINNDRYLLSKIKKNKIIALAKKYDKFPKLDILASSINISSHQLIPILFNSFFNSATAGYFYLTQRMLGLPVSIISSAILDVFKEQASKDYKKNGNAKDIYVSTFKKLFLIAILPITILYFVVIDLFGIIFGEEWKIAGEYAQLLLPMVFLQFISAPLSFMFYIAEKQELNLILQSMLLFLVIGSFYVTINAVDTVIALSISFSIFYVIQIFLSSKIAKVF